MNEERHLRLLRGLQVLAKEKGISLEDLLEKAELGELVLEFWKEEGEKKEPEEVLGMGIDELVKEIRRLRENSK